MLIKDHDFEFAIEPDEVGMKTGATIHTMNGLQMRSKRNSEIPALDGWWEKQHLKRGLSATGLPYESESDADAWEAQRINMETPLPKPIDESAGDKKSEDGELTP